MPKRYLLLETEIGLTPQDLKSAEKVFERFGKVKVIPLGNNRRALILKTTPDVAREIREASGTVHLGGKGLRTTLTSGAIGKLKKRAGESGGSKDDKVSQ